MEKRKTITVFTPTYNRGYILGKLYDSLRRQTVKDFQWIIVDDGSSDDTGRMVEQWQKEAKLPILYYRQENRGKMQAHNKGLELCDTELFLCVDSDDYLVDTAVEELLDIWEREKTDKKLAGIVAKRGRDVKTPLGSGEFPNARKANMRSIKKNGFTGDTTLCFRTEVIKKYPFPKIENEKFLSERYVYDQMDHDGYEYIVYPQILTICEYLEDGYTRNMDVISYQNPVGRMCHEAQNMEYANNLQEMFRAAARYNQYKRISGHEDVRCFLFREKIALFLMYAAGNFAAVRKKRRVEDMGK